MSVMEKENAGIPQRFQKESSDSEWACFHFQTLLSQCLTGVTPHGLIGNFITRWFCTNFSIFFFPSAKLLSGNKTCFTCNIRFFKSSIPFILIAQNINHGINIHLTITIDSVFCLYTEYNEICTMYMSLCTNEKVCGQWSRWYSQMYTWGLVCEFSLICTYLMQIPVMHIIAIEYIESVWGLLCRFMSLFI